MLVSSDPAYYRQRAEHCRGLAETARDEATLHRLLAMANDLEDEARRLEEADQRNEG